MIMRELTKLKGKYKSFMHFWARLLITTQQTSNLYPRDTIASQLINNTTASMSSSFSIDTFATEVKAVMNEASKSNIKARQQAATKYFKETLKKYGTEEIKVKLNEAIPAGADIGEMMMHTSNELTMIYARVPPRFMSAVHNHTLFACIGCLEGKEDNTIYSLQNGSMDLPPKIDRQFTITSGEVIELPHVSMIQSFLGALIIFIRLLS